jgi:hypothetical protein
MMKKLMMKYEKASATLMKGYRGVSARFHSACSDSRPQMFGLNGAASLT